MVRTAPFITRSRCPFCSTTASVRRVFASKGAKETGVTAGNAVEHVALFRCGKECEINRILIGLLRCKCAGK